MRNFQVKRSEKGKIDDARYKKKCTHLWYKHEAQCGRATKNDENGQHHEHGVLLVGQYKANCRTCYAHNNNVVDAHADVLAVV